MTEIKRLPPKESGRGMLVPSLRMIFSSNSGQGLDAQLSVWFYLIVTVIFSDTTGGLNA